MNPALEQAKLAQRDRAQQLHETMFGTRTQMDLARLSLADQRLMLDKAQALERATLARTRMNLQLKRGISAAAAIERLGVLDPADPKFLQKMTAITSQYPDALGSTAFQKIFEDRREDHKLVQDANAARIASTFNDPDVAAAHASALATTNDPKFANAAAAAAKEQKDKAKLLATSTDLSPEERATVYNPTDGKFNLDPTVLTKLEMKANTVKSQRAAAEALDKPVTAVANALKSLGSPDDTESPAIKAARFNLEGHLKDATFAAAQPVAPVAPADDHIKNELASLLGGPAPVTPAAPAPVAPATPVASSDNADPDDLLNDPEPVEE